MGRAGCDFYVACCDPTMASLRNISKQQAKTRYVETGEQALSIETNDICQLEEIYVRPCVAFERRSEKVEQLESSLIS